MRAGIKIVLVVGAALLGTWLFEKMLTTMIYSSWFNNSPGTDSSYSTDLRQLYVFAYLVVFALAGALQWPVSVKRRVIASAIVLAGAVLPLTAVLMREYLRAHWPISDIFNATERSAMLTLLVAHGVALLLSNGLLYLTNLKRPLRSTTTQSALEVPGRVAGTMYLGK